MSEKPITQKDFDEYKKSIEELINKDKKEKVNETKPKQLSSYQLFVKEKFAEVQTKNPDMKSKEVIKKLSELWNEKKVSTPIE